MAGPFRARMTSDRAARGSEFSAKGGTGAGRAWLGRVGGYGPSGCISASPGFFVSPTWRDGGSASPGCRRSGTGCASGSRGRGCSPDARAPSGTAGSSAAATGRSGRRARRASRRRPPSGLSHARFAEIGIAGIELHSMTCEAGIRRGSIGTACGHIHEGFHRGPVLRAPGIGADVLRRTMRP